LSYKFKRLIDNYIFDMANPPTTSTTKTPATTIGASVKPASLANPLSDALKTLSTANSTTTTSAKQPV
jgi:hypothetical protein